MSELFPYVLTRVSGDAFGNFAKLHSPQLKQDAISYHNLMIEIANSTRDLVTLSKAKIITTDQKTLRSLLIQLIRDVLADRVKSNTLSLLSNHDGVQDVTKWLTNHLHLLDMKLIIHEQFDNLYLSEQSRVHRQLLLLSKEESFQKGLILSSESLFSTLKHRGLKIDDYRKKDKTLDNGLIKYISRYYTKTTPYSTFTNLSIDAFVDLDQSKSVSISQFKDNQMISHVRLNGYLLQMLFDYFVAIWDICGNISVRLNPTIKFNDGDVIFLVNFNNVESFQQLSFDSALNLIHSMLIMYEGGVQLNKFLQVLFDLHLISASHDELKVFILSLIDTGFIEFIWPASGIDPLWTIKVVDFLEKCEESESAHKVKETLIDLNALTQRYETVNSETRYELLSTMHNKIEGLLSFLNTQVEDEAKNQRKPKEEVIIAEPPETNNVMQEQNNLENQSAQYFKRNKWLTKSFKKELMIYEDSVSSFNFSLDKNYFTIQLMKFEKLLNYLHLFESTKYEKKRMADFYISKYASKEVGILDFYHDYYKEVKTKNTASGDGKEKREFSDYERETVKKKSDFMSQYNKVIVERYDSLNKEYRLYLSDIPEVEYNHVANTSIGFFLQVAQKTESLNNVDLLVVNSTVHGCGKLMSRFLHLFNEEVITSLQAYNSKMIEDAILVENRDASFFNANLHPPLLKYEIWTPGSNTFFDPSCQISIADLQITLNSTDSTPELVYKKTGEKVYILDLGFQGQRGHSELYNLLSQFSPFNYINYSEFLTSINNYILQGEGTTTQETGIVNYPRIIFEDSIVLQRKLWKVKRDALPLKTSDESESEHYLRIVQWAYQNNIPDEIFVRLSTAVKTENSPGRTVQSKLRNHDYKPQYINFTNLILVSLFASILQRVEDYITIEEMLPSSEQLFDYNGDRRITEFVVQLYL